MHINPDHFLETPQGRHLSALRNKIAWDLSFQALDLALKCGIAECCEPDCVRLNSQSTNQAVLLF